MLFCVDAAGQIDGQHECAAFPLTIHQRTGSQPGDFEAEYSQMIKSGNRYLRYYLLEAANSVRRCNSEFRRYYDLKFKEVNKCKARNEIQELIRAQKNVERFFAEEKDTTEKILTC